MANKIVQGLVLPESSALKYINDYNKNAYGRGTFSDAMASASIAGQKLSVGQTINYSQAMNEAYAASMANRQGILSSGLGTGAKQSLLNSQTSALYKAYDAQQANLANALSEIRSKVQASQQSIYGELQGMAQNSTVLFDEALNYLYALEEDGYSGQLQKLYGDMFTMYGREFDEKTGKYTDKYGIGDVGKVYNASTGEYSVQYELDKNGNIKTDKEGNPIVVKDEDGNPIYVYENRLRNRDEMLGWISEQDPDTGEIVLNERGRDLMDRILNSSATLESAEFGFGEYLAEKNPDLYNWMLSYNEYNYGGYENTNASMFKSMMGLDKNDNAYSFQERYGGYTEKEIEHLAEPLITAITESIEAVKDIETSWHRDAIHTAKGAYVPEDTTYDTVRRNKKKVKNIGKELEGLKSMAEKFGVYDEYAERISELENEIKATGDITNSWQNFWHNVSHNGLNDVNKKMSRELRKDVAAIADTIKQMYLDIANDMLETSLKKQRSRELEFNSMY